MGERSRWRRRRLSFFSLNLATRVADKLELQVGVPPFPTGTALDEDPQTNLNANNGDLDWFNVDEKGNLVISESGFFDVSAGDGVDQNGNGNTADEEYGLTAFGAHQPKPISEVITDYSAGDTETPTPNGVPEILPGVWDTKAAITEPVDDDAGVVADGRFGVYVPSQDASLVSGVGSKGYIYYFDIDTGAAPGVVADVYVYDIATEAVIYSELNAANHFFADATKIRAFALGDFTEDGKTDVEDIDFLNNVLAGSPSALTAERYDLTGNNALTAGNPLGVGAIAGDVDYLVRRILATEYGDVDLNRILNSDDSDLIDFNLNTLGGWGSGDGDGDSSERGVLRPKDRPRKASRSARRRNATKWIASSGSASTIFPHIFEHPSSSGFATD